MQAPRVSVGILLGAAIAFGVPGCAHAAQSEEQKTQVLRLIHQARDAMQRGDLPAAETLFEQAVVVAPEFPDAYLGLGLVQLRHGELDEAIRSLDQSVALNARLKGAHLFLGIAEYQAGRASDAEASLRAELALQPANIEALTWLGIVELGRDDPEAATGPLDQAAALSPDNAQVLYYRGRAHMLVAEAAYHQLSALDPDSALVHRGLAESLDGANQPEKAIAEYELAIQRDPANPDLYDELGTAEQKMSRLDDAKAAYEKELRLNPHSAIALYNVGRLDVERGQPEAGVALLRQAADAHAGVAPTSYYLGLGLVELGKSAEALPWFEKALANQPSAFVEQGAWFQLGRVYRKLGRDVEAKNAQLQLNRILAAQEQEKSITAKKAVERSTAIQATQASQAIQATPAPRP